jgi:hypothetical protein
MRRRALAFVTPLLAAAAAWPRGLAAQPASAALAAPTAAPVLSVGGRIQRRNQGERAVFDMPMLEALPQRDIVARTPWYAEPRKFTGPLLRDLLERVAADGRSVRAIALNDYRVDIPVEDARRFDVIIARLLDDRPMPVREKGPLFVMYPFDAHPELRTAIHFSRCIWQLRALEVL